LVYHASLLLDHEQLHQKAITGMFTSSEFSFMV
jgi:hypothetical protein